MKFTERMLLNVESLDGVVEMILVLHQSVKVSIYKIAQLVKVPCGGQRSNLSHVLLERRHASDV